VIILALLRFFLSLSFWVRLIWVGLPPLVSFPAFDACVAGMRFFFVDSDFDISFDLCAPDFTSDLVCAYRFDRDVSFDDETG
jgi:hypothetical protein